MEWSCGIPRPCNHEVETTARMGDRPQSLGLRRSGLPCSNPRRGCDAMRICHVVYAYFPADPLFPREVESLRGAGHAVAVISLRHDRELSSDTVRGVAVVTV